MTIEDNDFGEVIETDYTDWKELQLPPCPQCGSHELVKCLGGQVVYALVDKIIYKPEEYVYEEESDGDEGEYEDEELEDVDDACVSVQTRPDGTELWDFGVDEANDSYSWFRCSECGYEPRFKDGGIVEDDNELARWILEQKSSSKADQGN